jgi:hypothetical protein
MATGILQDTIKIRDSKKCIMPNQGDTINSAYILENFSSD